MRIPFSMPPGLVKETHAYAARPGTSLDRSGREQAMEARRP